MATQANRNNREGIKTTPVLLGKYLRIKIMRLSEFTRIIAREQETTDEYNDGTWNITPLGIRLWTREDFLNAEIFFIKWKLIIVYIKKHRRIADRRSC